MFSEMIRCA